MASSTARHGRRIRIAIVLAMLSLLVPAGVPVALAADELRLEGTATYRVDPADGVVRVRVDLVATNLKPNSVRTTATERITTRYFYDGIQIGIQPAARSVRATSGGTTLRTALDTKEGYRQLTVRMAPLYYRQRRTIRVEFELPGGKPRSASDVRVGAAFTTFTAWAWGDPGRGSVRIVLPAGFEDSGYGTSVTSRESDGRWILSSGTIAEPGSWYRVISADRAAALTDVRVGPPDEPIVVQAWPEDTAWRDQVASVLGDGVPILKDLIGLPWPVPDELVVTEVHTPLLEGYAGTYDSRTDRIRVSEDLDATTILHEAAHAWFDDRLIDERWITEGLAQVYAARVHEQLGLEGDVSLPEVSASAAAAFPLDTWPAPERIATEEIDAREDFGYEASWFVMDRIVERAGDDGMQRVFQAMIERTNAYAGDGPPERAAGTMNWARFLDLVEEVGGAEGTDDLFRDWVLPPAQAAKLRERATARDAYDTLEALAGDWAPPFQLRRAMWAWRFDDATDTIDWATAVVERRDALADVVADLGTEPPADLEAAFEKAEARSALDAVRATIDGRIVAAEALIDARSALAVEPTPLVALGLVGEVPTSGLDAGLAAFRSGDVAAAGAGAATVMTLLAGAESVGTTRAAAIGVAVVGLLLLLLAVAWVLRRRRRRTRALTAGVAAASAGVAAAPAGATVDPSSTLPGTPDPADADPVQTSAPTTPDHGAEPD